jgi:hypothetical protein
LSIQHGGRDEHTYTTKQLKSANSGTPELDINYSMGGGGRATSGNFSLTIPFNANWTIWFIDRLIGV